MNIYRQGDILFVEVEEAVSGRTVRRKNGRIIVAEGEATGHAHAIATPGVKLIERVEPDPARLVEQFHAHYLVADKPFEVVHEEHDTVELPAGTFRVVRQREYSPEAIRTVAD